MQNETDTEKKVLFGARIKRGLRFRIKQDALDWGLTSEQVVDRILASHFALGDSIRRSIYGVRK